MKKRPRFVGRRTSSAGFRSDIGITVRSRWEANVTRYLNWLKQRGEIRSWQYEPRRFWFEGIRSGTTSYLPDFQIFYPDGRHEWWEVKGYWDPKSKTAVKRFRKYFPNETLVILDGKRYKELCLEFQEMIPNWERDAKNDPKLATANTDS